MKQMSLRDAKARFSELVEAASQGEPTTITRYGKPSAVLVPVEGLGESYAPKRKTLGQILSEIPDDLEFERDYTPMREIEL